MKRIISLVLLLAFVFPGRVTAQGTPEVTMLPASIGYVEPEFEWAVRDALAADAAARGLYNYAITDIRWDGQYYFVSVAGFPGYVPEWSLDLAAWLGLVTVAAVPGGGYVGIAQDDPATGSGKAEPARNGTEVQGFEGGGSSPILPFLKDTTATYGILGVHNCGFSLTGWKAVDFVSGPGAGTSPNMVYASLSGQVNYVCRQADRAQVAVRIGNNLYDHLVDTGQSVGSTYKQGDPIGAMILGTQNGSCGYTDQQPDHWHVHFCFVPNPDGTYYIDGYTLSVDDGRFRTPDGGEIGPNNLIEAKWTGGVKPGDPPPPPPPPPDIPNNQGPNNQGSNFWDGMLAGLVGAVSKIVPMFPDHEAMELAHKVVSIATVALQVVYVITLTNFDMTIPMWCLGIWFTLEIARLAYAAYMMIKRAIPVIG